MVTLPIKIKPAELPELAHICNAILKTSKYLLSGEQYLHFYNLRSLVKKLLDKNFAFLHSRKNSVTLRININEYSSLKYCTELCRAELNAPGLLYHNILLSGVFAQLDKQVKQLPGVNSLE